MRRFSASCNAGARATIPWLVALALSLSLVGAGGCGASETGSGSSTASDGGVGRSPDGSHSDGDTGLDSDATTGMTDAGGSASPDARTDVGVDSSTADSPAADSSTRTCLPVAKDAAVSPACSRTGSPDPTTTLTVDITTILGAATHAASGGLEGLAVGTMPPDSLVAPLHPKVFTQAADGTSPGLNPTADALKVAPQAASVGAKVEIRLADTIDSYPYVWPGWTQWLALVDQVVNARLSATTITNIGGYELWNEPNLNWDAAAGTFDDWWVRTFNEVRSLDKTTPIVGPSWNTWVEGLMSSFLSNAKANNALPDYVSWHELQGSARISGDIAAYRNLETSLGIPHLPISINEYARSTELGVPGSLVGYIAQFERTGVDHACLGNWFPPLGTFDCLVVDDSQPNGAWWLYKWYGDMSGSMVATKPATQSGLDGAASVNGSTQVVSVILGGAAGAGAVLITGLDQLDCYGDNAQVTLESVPSPGRTVAVTATTTVSTTTVPICNGSVTVPLSSMLATSGYHLLVQPAP